MAGSLALLPAAAPVAAQTLGERPEQEFLARAATVSSQDAAGRCVTPLSPLQDNAAPTRQECRVVDFRPLGESPAAHWSVAQYRRSAIVHWIEPADTVDWDEIVLFRSARPDSVQPIWHIRTERIFEFLSDVRAEPRSEGLLIEVVICLNGTGGCTREYALASDGDLHLMDKSFADSLQARLPDDHYLHKGMTLDLQTLRGTWPVAAPGDANCCPSLVFDYAVRLDGNDLVLVTATLRPSGGQAPRPLTRVR